MNPYETKRELRININYAQLEELWHGVAMSKKDYERTLGSNGEVYNRERVEKNYADTCELYDQLDCAIKKSIKQINKEEHGNEG